MKWNLVSVKYRPDRRFSSLNDSNKPKSLHSATAQDITNNGVYVKYLGAK
jgi:hypothetical protein